MISIIITAHETDYFPILDMAMSQTYPDTEIIVLASGVTNDAFPHLKEPNLNDYGHAKRRKGLSICNGEYVTFWNADDWYEPTFLEKLYTATQGEIDLAYCNFKSHLFGGGMVDSQPVMGAITSGSFIVKTSTAREVGYNHDIYQADGLFIDELVAHGASTVKVGEVLYVHR